jgi:hypothetical protein
LEAAMPSDRHDTIELLILRLVACTNAMLPLHLEERGLIVHRYVVEAFEELLAYDLPDFRDEVALFRLLADSISHRIRMAEDGERVS